MQAHQYSLTLDLSGVFLPQCQFESFELCKGVSTDIVSDPILILTKMWINYVFGTFK